jgi:hypothetical protein
MKKACPSHAIISWIVLILKDKTAEVKLKDEITEATSENWPLNLDKVSSLNSMYLVFLTHHVSD